MKKGLLNLLVLGLILSVATLSSCKSNNNSNTSYNPNENIKLDISLDGYIANITDSKSIGIKEFKHENKTNLTNTEMNKNTIVTSNGDDTYNVSFTKIETDTEQKEEIDEKFNVIAKSDKKIIEIISKTDNSFTFKSLPQYKYCLVLKNDESKIISEYITSTSDKMTLSFNDPNIKIEDVKIKSINLNSSISFNYIEGLNYEIIDKDENVIYKITDESKINTAQRKNIITLDGFEENQKYTVHYYGKGNKEVITQETLKAEIDKLYVSGDFTFVSFVKEGKSNRFPKSSIEMENPIYQYDYHNVLNYDKQDYFTDSENRKSYIIENNTGLMYLLSDFKIKKISNGLIFDENDFVYDLSIDENNELKLTQLFTNSLIKAKSVCKDKYGHKFIENNKLNFYDKNTDTLFYKIVDSFNGEPRENTTIYSLTSNNETIELIYDQDFDKAVVINANIINKDGSKRELNEYDNFDILYQDNNLTDNFSFKVKNGLLYGGCQNGRYNKVYSEGIQCFIYDPINNRTVRLLDWSLNEVNKEYLFEYGCVFFFEDNKIKVIENIWETMIKQAEHYMVFLQTFERKVIINDCSLENDKIMKYGINGNIYYDLICEDVNGKLTYNYYEEGTYVEPNIIKFQPIN